MTFWILAIVGAYAYTAWLVDGIAWRIDFLVDKLMNYAEEKGQCSIT